MSKKSQNNSKLDKFKGLGDLKFRWVDYFKVINMLG